MVHIIRSLCMAGFIYGNSNTSLVEQKSVARAVHCNDFIPPQSTQAVSDVNPALMNDTTGGTIRLLHLYYSNQAISD
jgi:hypothetical protein